jgi:hypothetical protein
MGVDAKQVPNAGPAVLLAVAGLAICLLLAIVLAAFMILPLAGAGAPLLPRFEAPAVPPPHRRAGSGSLQAAPSELATLTASEAVDRALGRPVVRSAIVLPSVAPVAKSQAPAAAQVPVPAEAPVHQVLPPPPGAAEPAPVFAAEYAAFLDADAATRFSAALAARGLSARMVEQRDEAGRTWIYLRSQAFTDAAMALAFAAKVEQSFGLSALLVTEPAPAPAPQAKGAAT